MVGLKFNASEVVKLINSTDRGPVLKRRILRDHLDASGYHVARNNKVDLIKYAAWLTTRLKIIRHNRQVHEQRGRNYLEHRDMVAERRRAESISQRNIGEIPEIKDSKRRETAMNDFRYFCQTYFPDVFYLPFSSDHEIVINKMIRVAEKGGQFAIAMPRGSGKTALCQRIIMWMIFRGKKKYIIAYASTLPMAEQFLDEIKEEIETNELLFEDFPEICMPVRSLGGVTQRAHTQLYHGERTKLEWATNQVTFARIPGSLAGGGMIDVIGLDGSKRGARRKGRRPDLLVFDDPQTDQSARSWEQCEKRRKIILAATKGMSAPGVKISAYMPCTVIERGDLSEMMLDREQYPEWQGERMKTLYEFPTNTDLWNEYEKVRVQSLENYGDIREATEFYRENMAAMDEGAVVAWKERWNDGEISAIQSAMEVKFEDIEIFQSEFQNEPINMSEDGDQLTVRAILNRYNNLKRGIAPATATKLTAFVDIQHRILYWMVVAWEENFTGYIIDYGTTPKQKVSYFSNRTANITMSVLTKATSNEAKWMAGLEKVCHDLIYKDWKREDGQRMDISRLFLDAADGLVNPTVRTFCRRTHTPGIVMPYIGTGIDAKKRPMSEYRKQRGDRIGLNWRIAAVRKQRTIPHVLSDVNFWKSFTKARLLTPAGDPGGVTIFGSDPRQHRLLAEHLVSEYATKTEGYGRVVYSWAKLPHRDNHWWDCLVGNAVAASEQGIVLPEYDDDKKNRRYKRRMTNERKKRLEERRRERQERRRARSAWL